MDDLKNISFLRIRCCRRRRTACHERTLDLEIPIGLASKLGPESIVLIDHHPTRFVDTRIQRCLDLYESFAPFLRIIRCNIEGRFLTDRIAIDLMKFER